jgi:hypothetical protein
LKAKYDDALSNFAFNFNSRRYGVGSELWGTIVAHVGAEVDALIKISENDWPKAGGSFRTTTRPTLNRRTESSRLIEKETSACCQ